MVYQNNNNRVNPNFIEDRHLKPAATPADKMLRYSPQYGQTGGYVNTAKALSDIGKGLMDVDTLLRIQSQDNALRAIWETKDENKKEWASVSRNIKGAAKFNPYNDDAYRKIQSNDIYRAAYLGLATTPDLDKMDREKFTQLVEDTTKKMIEGFKETGLSPKDYGEALVQWDNSMKSLDQHYTIKNAEYRFKETQTKIASNTSFSILTALNERPEEVSSGVVIKEELMKSDEMMKSLGYSPETRIGVHFATIQGMLAKEADSITMADLNEALGDIELDGKKAEEFIPNYHTQLRQLYKQAKQAIYDDKYMAYQDHQLDLKIASQDANKELYQWIQQNPNANNTQTLQQVQELINKYDLEENGFDFINQIARDKNTLEEFQSVQSDPSVLQELGAKAALGTLTGEDVNQAIINGQLNWKEGLQFSDRINRETKANINAVKQSYNDYTSKLNKNGLYAQQLGANSEDVKKLKDEANRLITGLSNGEKSVDEVSEGLQQLERITQAKARMKQNKATNDSFLLNANYIKSQQAPAYNAEAAIGAFKQLGLERGSYGQKLKPDVTSRPDENRKINGKSAPHKGYDLAATNDTRIHSVNMKGTCVYAGFLPDFGNYVVIKYDNGTYMRAGHLSTSTKHLQGKVIPAGSYIGNAGSTGYSTGTHLHVDFWNKNRELISVERFQRLMR